MSQNTQAAPVRAASTPHFVDLIKVLEHGCSGNMPLDLRDQAIVAVLKTTAARASSVGMLRVRDVELYVGALWLPWRGTERRHRVALLPEAAFAISTYLAFGRPWLLGVTPGPGGVASSGSGRLFLAQNSRSGAAGRPLNTSALSAMLTRRYHVGGGTRRFLGSHEVRSVVIELLARGGLPLVDLARLIGHGPTTPAQSFLHPKPQPAAGPVEAALRNVGL